MEELYQDYLKIDRRKSSRGKLKRLGDFWHKVRVAIWTNFNWKHFDHNETGDQQKVVEEVNNVRTVFRCDTAN